MTLRHLAIIATVLGAAARSSGLAAQTPAACLSQLTGTWEGTGRVAGRSILMRQEWGSSLRGAFFELSMLHLSAADSSTTLFSGRGFYRPRSDSVFGTWLDSRGLTFQLRGACREGTLHMVWSGDAESGDTQYAVQPDGTLLVIDRVTQANNLREFGRTTLRRAAPHTPTLLAPGIISADLPDFATSIAADGSELWFNRTSPDRSQIVLFRTQRAPGIVGARPAGERPPGDIYQVSWNAIKPRCSPE